MKVVQHTPNTLILRWFSHSPWLNSVAIVILGLLILAIGGQRTTLVCDHSESNNGQCDLKTQQLFRSNSQSISVQDLQGAKVQGYQQNSPSPLYRVLLMTSSQPVPLTAHFSADYVKQQSSVEKLELFIEDPEARPLRISDYGHSWVYLLGGIAIATGVVSAALSMERTTLSFDNSANYLQIHHQRLFASWTDEYDLQTVINVELGSPPTTIPQFNTQLQKIKKEESPCVHIQFESGNRLPISLDPKQQPVKQAVRHIRDFLKESGNVSS